MIMLNVASYIYYWACRDTVYVLIWSIFLLPAVNNTEYKFIAGMGKYIKLWKCFLQEISNTNHYFLFVILNIFKLLNYSQKVALYKPYWNFIKDGCLSVKMQLMELITIIDITVIIIIVTEIPCYRW